MGAHSCSLKEPIKLLTQKGAPLSRKVLLPMLTAKVLTPDLVALYGKYFEDNYRLVERVKFDVARAAELFRTDVAVLVSKVARQEEYIEMQVKLMRDWHPPREKLERWERLMEHIEDTRREVTALRRRLNSEFEGRFFETISPLEATQPLLFKELSGIIHDASANFRVRRIKDARVAKGKATELEYDLTKYLDAALANMRLT